MQDGYSVKTKLWFWKPYGHTQLFDGCVNVGPAIDKTNAATTHPQRTFIWWGGFANSRGSISPTYTLTFTP
jgi:hypothetical protein